MGRPIVRAWAALALGLAACTRELTDVEPVARKVLLIGIEGLDFAVLEPLLEAGKMPCLAGLRKRGIALPLLGEHTTIDPASAGLDPARSWTTVATGAPAFRGSGDPGPFHGVLELRRRVNGSYAMVPTHSLARRLPAFWNVLSAVGVRCAIVNWWTTWPAEPVAGYLVSDRFFLARFGLGPFGPAGRVDLPEIDPSWRGEAPFLTWPDALERELLPLLEPFADRPAGPAFAWLRQKIAAARELGTLEDLKQVQQALHGDLMAKESALALLKRDPAIALLAVHFDALDVAGHHFWMHVDPARWQKSSDPALRSKLPGDYFQFTEAIPQVASALDGFVAELLARMGEETTLLLLSDHGLQPDLERSNRDFNLNPLLERLGLLARAADGAIDWARTRCFDRGGAPTDFNRRLALHFVGDWPQGVVEGPDSKARAAAWNEVRRRLLDLKVDRKWRGPSGAERDDLFWGAQEQPWEMVFAPHQALAAETKVKLPGGDVTIGTLFPARRTSARHSDPGVLLYCPPGEAGPALAARLPPLGKDAAYSSNVAPFLLALFGVPRSNDPAESSANADMLFWLLEREEAHRMSIRKVDSYAAALRRDDPSSALGARRAELARHLESVGLGTVPPAAVVPPGAAASR